MATNPAVTAGLSMLGPWGSIAGGLLGMFGGGMQAQQFDQTRGDIKQMAEFNPWGSSGPGGNTSFSRGQGRFGLSPQQQMMQAMMGGQGMNLMGGGLFNNQNFQDAYQNNDIAGAMNQSNFMNSQMMNPFWSQGMANGQGMVGDLFSQGMSNMQAAGNQQGLFDQSLASQRAAAQPQMDSQFNQLQNRQFAQGRLGSTGGAEQMGQMFQANNLADLGFQNNAYGQMMQQQNYLANLGMGQMGQGMAMENQGFNQMMSSLQQNQSAGNQRLQNAMGLFGMGTDTFNSQFGLGMQAQGGLMDQNRFGLENIMAMMNAENDRIGATGEHAGALADMMQGGGKGFGSFVSGLFS